MGFRDEMHSVEAAKLPGTTTPNLPVGRLANPGEGDMAATPWRLILCFDTRDGGVCS